MRILVINIINPYTLLKYKHLYSKKLFFQLEMTKKGIEQAIFTYIKDSSPRPVSTREISEHLKFAWHTADRYCLKLQLQKKVGAYTIGKATAWYLLK